MRIPKQHSLPRDLVKVRRADHIIDTTATFDLGINAGVFPPIISKEEKDIWRSSTSRCSRGQANREQA